MQKLSLVDRIERYFKARPGVWIHKGEVTRLAESIGYYAETCGRRLRESESGIGSNGKPCKKFLENMENEKGHVMYRYLPKEVIRSSYQIVDGRAVMVEEKVLA